MRQGYIRCEQGPRDQVKGLDRGHISDDMCARPTFADLRDVEGEIRLLLTKLHRVEGSTCAGVAARIAKRVSFEHRSAMSPYKQSPPSLTL